MAPLDSRRDIEVLETNELALDYAARHFLQSAQKAIKERGQFLVALSGGHTPKAIFERLLKPAFKTDLDWSKVKLFWGDERAVPPEHPDSNYKMAMESAFSKLPLNPNHIYRLRGEGDLEKEAKRYEECLKAEGPLDLIMLGMGDDGHTASLFPHTKALDIAGSLVVANFVPQKDCWRLTFTYEGLHFSRSLVFYVFGENKALKVNEVLKGPYDFHALPSQKVGTASVKALWLLDKKAASKL